MKKLKLTTTLTALLLVFTFQSCVDDDNEDYGYSTIATVKVIDGQNYYLGLDDGEKMYPSDTTSINSYKVTDGQRAFVWFEKMDVPKEGYEYNIKLKDIYDILTKGVIPLTEETADSIGDNRISLYDNVIWATQDYLTLSFCFLGTSSPAKKHMLNLVQNETMEYEDDGYIHLELRHNAYDDPQDQLLIGYVSFKLDEIAEQMGTAKGMKVRINSIENGEEVITLDFPVAEFLKSKSNFSFQGAAHSTRTIY